jgi:rhodanese-related sulfurtransferase
MVALRYPRGYVRRENRMHEVDLGAFAVAHASGAIVIDVREPDEYVTGHVPGARMVPLARLAQVSDLPRNRPVYVICASGNRSKAGASLLTGAGVNAYSVAGGTGAWMSAGRPVVQGTRES